MGRRVTNGLTGNVGSSISSLSVVDNSLITVTTNQNVVIDPNGSGHVFTDAPFESTNATGSTTKATGAITTSGGIGAAGQIHAAGLNVTPTSTLKFSAQDQYILVPNGTTAQRPTGGALKTGGIRYNSSLVTWEGYNGTQWTGLGGGNPWATHTADGSTALTVAANDRYFIDTTAGAQTVNLPASPQVGDQVSFVDLAGTFDTSNLTIGRNSLKIMGLSSDMTVSTENAGIQLVYTGATYGWKLTQNI